jgi:membrane-associated phospholipid phosphatase
MAYVDRPVADYVQTHLRQTALFAGAARALGPLPLMVVLALVFLLGAGCWALDGRALASWTQTPLLCSWSAVWSLSVTIVLKHIFGRSSPDPLYVVHRAYEFHWLQGGPGYEAFPSGTTAITAAILSVVWIRVPRLRTVCVLLFAFVSIALILTNGHWVADVLGGGFLGASIGWMTVLLLRLERPPRVRPTAAPGGGESVYPGA